MNNRLLKKILMFIAIGTILCSCMIPAFAVDKSQTGVLDITMEYQKEPVSGGLIALYYVAELNEDDSYTYTEDFKDCNIPIKNLNDKQYPVKLAEFAENKNINTLVKEVNPNGKVMFDRLDEGLYLVVQVESAKGFEKIAPFLVEFPYHNQESGEWEYVVNANPKLNPDEPDMDVTNPQEPQTQPQPNEHEIPHTGQLNWPIPVLAFAGVLLFIIGWSLYYTKVKK